MPKPFSFETLFKDCPAALTREGIEKATGGIYTARYLANLDAKGEGIPGRFRVGRKILYPTKNAADFFDSRTTSV